MINRCIVLVLGLWIACFAPGGDALAQTGPQTRSLTPVAAPPEPPFLRIDAEFHTQVVNRFAMDRDGRIVVTASDDKTLRVWRVADGTALATLRVPIADGDEGALYAVALSPDGRTLLAGGFTGFAWDRSFAIYIFDMETQRLRGRLPNLPAPINHIAYAPDGHSFAIALAGSNGIRLIDAQTGALIAADTDFRDRATWVDFDESGRLVAVGFDGDVRLYDATGKRIARRAPVAGGHPYGVAFSPDGRAVAVGYTDQPRVEVLNGQTLAARTSLVSPGGSGTGFGAVAWGADGSLFAAGSVRGTDGATLVRHWPAGGGKPADMPGLRDTVFQIAALPDGGVVLVGADPALARLDRTGHSVFRKTSPGLDFRDVSDRRFHVSEDGLSVQIQTKAMTAVWLVDMAERKVTSIAVTIAATRALTPVAAPSSASPALHVTSWRNEAVPRIEGQPIGLDREELSRSYAVTPSQEFVVLGTDYKLRVVRRDGHPADSVALPGPAWAVGVSGDGRMVVAAVGDGTLRWFGLDADGRLTPRVSVFLAADGKRWVVWTDGGFFDYSDQGGEQLVGLLLNRSRAQVPDWFSFAQVYRLFYAPETVVARLRGQDSSDPSTGAAGLRALLTKAPPPQIDLESVCWTVESANECRPIRPSTSRDATAQTAEVTLPATITTINLHYRLAGAVAEKDTVDVFVNGRNAGRTEGEVSRGDGEEITQSAPVDPGLNQIQLRAYDHDGLTYAQSQLIRLARSAQAGALIRKPELFILSVGINRYPPTINALNFAVADARSVASSIKDHAPASYGAVDETELYDEAATAPAVLSALNGIAARAEASDTVIIYLSGHGVQFDKRYYFITQNVGSLEAVPVAAVSEEALIKALANIRAKNGLLFLDTCHAGAFSLDSASQIAHESGRYVLAASASVEEALDSYDNHNGVFATAVLRGLAGEGGEDAKGIVNNFQLGLFVTPLVRQLASEKHHNQSAKFKIDADDAEPFPIAQVAQ